MEVEGDHGPLVTLLTSHWPLGAGVHYRPLSSEVEEGQEEQAQEAFPPEAGKNSQITILHSHHTSSETITLKCAGLKGHS